MNKKEQKVGDPLCWLVQEVILKWVTPNFGRSRKEAALRERSRGLTCHCDYGKKEKGKIPHSIHVPFVAFISGKLPSSKRGPSCCGPVALPCEPTNSSFTHKPQNHRRSLNSLLPSVIYCSSL